MCAVCVRVRVCRGGSEGGVHVLRGGRGAAAVAARVDALPCSSAPCSALLFRTLWGSFLRCMACMHAYRLWLWLCRMRLGEDGVKEADPLLVVCHAMHMCGSGDTWVCGGHPHEYGAQVPCMHACMQHPSVGLREGLLSHRITPTPPPPALFSLKPQPDDDDDDDGGRNTVAEPLPKGSVKAQKAAAAAAAGRPGIGNLTPWLGDKKVEEMYGIKKPPRPPGH